MVQVRLRLQQKKDRLKKRSEVRRTNRKNDNHQISNLKEVCFAHLNDLLEDEQRAAARADREPAAAVAVAVPGDRAEHRRLFWRSP